MNILLINPPFHRLREFRHISFPMGIGSLAAYTNKPGREVRLYNSDIPTKQELKFWKNTDVVRLLESSKLFENNLKSDSSILWDEVRQVIRDYKPDVVGVSVMTCKFSAAKKLTQLVKSFSKNIITVWGGPHCSVMGIDALKNNECIDYAIAQEGEIAFESLIQSIEEGKANLEIPNLIYRINGQIKKNPTGTPIKNLDDLPFAIRDTDIFQERYPELTFDTIMASRGCSFQCTFCDTSQVWGRKIRYRSAENIIAEIKELNSKFGITDFHFCDDTFTINSKHTLAFCNELKKSNLKVCWSCNTRVDVLSDDLCKAMKESEVSYVSLGIESGSERILKLIKKGFTKESIRKGIKLLEKYGIDWHAFFMVGFPMETVEDIKLTREFWREIKPSKITLSTYTPWPGTELYKEAEKLGVITKNHDWSSISYQNLNNHFVANIPKNEFRQIVKSMFVEVDEINLSYFNLVNKFFKRRNYYLRNLPRFSSIAFKRIANKIMDKRR